MDNRRIGTLVTAALLAVLPLVAAADETVETRDGRKVLLRADGTYEFQSKLDPAILRQAVASARRWAQDQTLILYCLRNNPNRDMIAVATVKDSDAALAHLRHAGATEQQLAQVAAIVAAELRTERPAGEDKAMNATCIAQNVEKSVELLQPIAWPLDMRSPFKELR